ncbi:hypothetical protein [Tahibacter amnicola]|uniref:Uncharacterized protein n=1 Tax=Tahibacter amnicola TaxID=2976241 RepID=A0ABY6BK20_9GAMM|nr:hypothetical protein [Tahibacter amnicola]UXI70356.1 hypothetical protein N4264_12200 [Tahibacter amnicola]
MMRCLIVIPLLAAAGLAVAAATPPRERVLGGLLVDNAGGRGSAVPLEIGQARLVVVLDARSTRSHAAIDALRREGYRGRSAVVLVIGDAESSRAFARRRQLLPEARWVSARSAAVLMPLQLSGMPAILGIDKEQRIRWQETGVAERSGDFAVRINDWLNSGGGKPAAVKAPGGTP